MQHPRGDEPAPTTGDLGEENVERLLKRSYRPDDPADAPPKNFARRLDDRLVAAAAARAEQAVPRPLRILRAFAPVAAAASLLAIVALSLRTTPRTIVPDDPGGALVAQVDEILGLSPSPAPAAAPTVHAATGTTIRTGPRERRRVSLDDGSVLFVDANTEIALTGVRDLRLASGEVYVEVAPDAALPFRVRARDRTYEAVGTRFAVAADSVSELLVTHGSVRAGGAPRLVVSGERFWGDKIVPATDVAESLAWTRDLVAAAQSPLVPKSGFEGGALIAIDPTGQEARLTLRKFHVDVHIEDGFARTTIDQTYFNHATWRMEGTFYFPLPADASLSRLAMYVAGKRMEGGMTERSHARDVYETIRTTRRDPALLEWIDGSTFKMRVFPLEPREEKRILLSYTQRLPERDGVATYRFPSSHTLDLTSEWSFGARVVGGAKLAETAGWSAKSHDLAAKTDGADLVLSAAERGARLDRDLVLTVRDRDGAWRTSDAPRFSSFEHEGARYLMGRWRPHLDVAEPPRRRDWIFLVETGAGRDPVVARAQIEIVRTMLSLAESKDTVTVLSASTSTRPLTRGAVRATPENTAAVIDLLGRSHIVGALDLEKAIAATRDAADAVEAPWIVHVGGGVAVLGERDPAVLANRLPEKARYVGVAVGRRWSREFMRLAADLRSGVVTQITPDEPLAWRAFETVQSLSAPTLRGITVASADSSSEKLPWRARLFASSVSAGDEIAFVTRLEKGEPMPGRVSVSGTSGGARIERTFDVKDVRPGAGYLPREWARLEIERLLEDGREEHRAAVTALSKSMYVITPFTSLIVLEDDAMYTQFNVDRGRKDHWAMYAAPDQIPVVRELRGEGTAGAPRTPDDVRAVLGSILVRGRPSLVMDAVSQNRWIDRDPTARTVLEWHQIEDQYADQFAMWDGDFEDGLLQLGAMRSSGLRTFGIYTFGGGGGGGGARTSSGGSGPRGGLGDRLERFRDLSEIARRELGSSSRFSRMSGAAAANFERSTLSEGMPFGGSPGGLGGIWFSTRDEAGKERSGLAKNARRRAAAGYRAKTENVYIRTEDPNGGLAPGSGSRPSSAAFFLRTDDDVDGDGYFRGLYAGRLGNGLHYQRPWVQNDPGVFRDLLAYCPATYTWDEDIAATLDAEAPDPSDARGTVDPAAKSLIDAARAAGWSRIRVESSDPAGAFDVVIDGAGRFAWSRTLDGGLREDAVSDGERILHVYRELGIAASRRTSRHHLARLRDAAPWLVDTADDLARGADVRLLDPRTVAVEPRGGSHRLELSFSADGPLAAWRVVEKASGRVVAGERYERTADGQVAVIIRSEDGTERTVTTITTSAADAPTLSTEERDLVVLPLPHRTADWLAKNRPADDIGRLAGVMSRDHGQFAQILKERFLARDDSRIGLSVLALSSRIEWSTTGSTQYDLRLDPRVAHPTSALAHYIAGVAPPNTHDTAVDVGDAEGAFARNLAELRQVVRAWQSGAAIQGDRRESALSSLASFATRTPFEDGAWAAISHLRNHGGWNAARVRQVKPAFERLARSPRYGYAARYDLACALTTTGDSAGPAEAAASFRTLCLDAARHGVVAPADWSLVQAMQQQGPEKLGELYEECAKELLRREDGNAVCALAMQVRSALGQPELSSLLLERLIDWTSVRAEDPTFADARRRTLLAIALTRRSFGEWALAERVLSELLRDVGVAKNADLWDLYAELAEAQGATASGLARRERALDISFESLPEIVDLSVVRARCGSVLTRYAEIATSLETVGAAASARSVARIVTTADRWRALDDDSPQACGLAAKALRSLGRADLAWDYLVTPLAARPNEAEPWSELGAQLATQDHEASLRAYEQAARIDPTNANHLNAQAVVLLSVGRRAEAKAVFAKVAAGTWRPEFEQLKRQAAALAR